MIKNTIFAAALAMVLVPASVLAQSDRSIIHAMADQVQPLLPGMKAPAFKVRNANDEAVSFNPASMDKPLIITFFRGGWCPYCNLHLAEMRKAESELKAMGFDIWFISMDRPEILYASLQDPDIGYTVLSDAKLEATRAFGVAFKVDDETAKKYLGYGVDLSLASGQDHHVLPAPSTFLIGTDGIIRFEYTNPNYTVRLHPDVLLAAAKSYVNDEDSRLARELQKSP